MNFRELINKLDQITEAESTLTLQSIAAVEKAAMDKAVAEKAKGGWTGFVGWDPRSAGNIALATLAQQNNFEGLFNSEGDFVIAYGTRTWSSTPGESPRRAPPTPDDWKPLAARGLIPQNANGPAELTNWLTLGGAKKEFDAVKKQSADAAAPFMAAQAPKILATDEDAKMTQLEGLVDQYLKLKADIKTGVKPVKGPEGKTDIEKKAEVNTPSTGTGIKLPIGAENPIGAALSKRIADLDPTGSKVDYRLDPEGKAKLNAMNENLLAQSLIESFGYQKKTDLNQIINNFNYGKNRSYSTKFRNTVLREVEKAKDNLKSLDNADAANWSDEDIQAWLKKEFGNRNDVKGLGGDKRTWDEKNAIAKFAAGNWENITWDDEILPGGLLTMRDLATDLVISTTILGVGTIAAPGLGTAGGAALGAGYLAMGIFVRVLARIAIFIIRYFIALGAPFWHWARRNPAAAKKAVSDLAKTYRDRFYKMLHSQFLKNQFVGTLAVTAIFNGLSSYLKHEWPEIYGPLEQGGKWVGDKVIMPAADAVDNVTGYRKLFKESLA
jgi:hypothetical protein